MSIQKVVVDREEYQWVPGGSLTVQGWKAVEGEKAAIEVLDDKGEPVKTEVTFFLRPDVVKRYPAYAAQADELGFRAISGYSASTRRSASSSRFSIACCSKTCRIASR